MWGLESVATRYLRPLVPAGSRNRLRQSVKNTIGTSASSRTSRTAWGFHQIERVRLLEGTRSSGWLDAIAVSAPERVDSLEKLDVASTFVPVGFHPDLVGDHSVARDIDVLFLGRVKGERTAILSRLERETARRGKRLIINEGPLFGSERTALLNRTKICINMSGLEGEFPRLRAVLAIAAGAVVLADDVGDTTPLVPGTHLLRAPVDRWPELIDGYSPEEMREPIATAAYRRLRDGWTMDHVAEQLGSLL
jgi:hypothetical protein